MSSAIGHGCDMTEYGSQFVNGLAQIVVSTGLGIAGDRANQIRADARPDRSDDNVTKAVELQRLSASVEEMRVLALGSKTLSDEQKALVQKNYETVKGRILLEGTYGEERQIENTRFIAQGFISETTAIIESSPVESRYSQAPAAPGGTPAFTGYNTGNPFGNNSNDIRLVGSGEPEVVDPSEPIDPFGGRNPYSEDWLATLDSIPSPVPPAITQTPTTPPAATAPAITPATLETADGKLKELQASDKWATINSTTVEFSYKKENGETAVVKTNLGEFLTEKLKGSQGWGGAGTKATTPEQYGAFVVAIEALKSGLSTEELGSFVAALQQRGVTEAATWWLVEEKRKNQQQQQATA